MGNLYIYTSYAQTSQYTEADDEWAVALCTAVLKTLPPNDPEKSTEAGPYVSNTLGSHPHHATGCFTCPLPILNSLSFSSLSDLLPSLHLFLMSSMHILYCTFLSSSFIHTLIVADRKRNYLSGTNWLIGFFFLVYNAYSVAHTLQLKRFFWT